MIKSWVDTKGTKGTIGQENRQKDKVMKVAKKRIALKKEIVSLSLFLINNRESRKGNTNINDVYFIETERPTVNAYKASCVKENFSPSLYPKDIIKTPNPNKILFGETWSIRRKKEGGARMMIKSTKKEEIFCLSTILEPKYINIRLRKISPALDNKIIFSTESMFLNTERRNVEK